MIQLTAHMRILVAVEPVDFRPGIDGLARLCREELRSDPFDGTVFVFHNRRSTAVKLLVFDGQGYWLAQKRLSVGRFRFWPTAGEATVKLEAHQLQLLLSAGDPHAAAAVPPPWRPLNAER